MSVPNRIKELIETFDNNLESYKKGSSDRNPQNRTSNEHEFMITGDEGKDRHDTKSNEYCYYQNGDLYSIGQAIDLGCEIIVLYIPDQF